MFGFIFHWGLYSVAGFDDVKSAKRRKTQNGSEWYLKRLKETGSYRPISGWKETQEFHKKYFQGLEYEQFQDIFLPNEWNPDTWMEFAKESGASYVILTTRHHDGYTLWPTRTTKYHSSIDLVGKFFESARKYELKVGVYYSWIEFEKSFTKEYIKNVVSVQIEELIRYQPDIWWFDGHWGIKSKYAKEYVQSVCKHLKELNSQVEINDRVIRYENPNELGCSTYRVYEDRCIPSEKPKVPWEHINTIGLSWGRNFQQTELDYKTGKELFELYETVNRYDGNFLLNLGPDKDGKLDPMEVRRIREFVMLKNKMSLR